MYPRREMLDLVLIDGKARGIITRNLITGEIERHAAHAVVLATGGYGTIYFLSTLAVNSNASAAWKAHKKGAFFANPSFVQIHPTSIPQLNEFQSKLTLMSHIWEQDIAKNFGVEGTRSTQSVDPQCIVSPVRRSPFLVVDDARRNLFKLEIHELVRPDHHGVPLPHAKTSSTIFCSVSWAG